MSTENPFPFDAEAIIGTMAKIAAMQGDAQSVAILAVSSPYFKINEHDNYNGGTDCLTLFLEVSTEVYACFFPSLEKNQENLLSILWPIIQPHQGYRATVVSIILANKVPNNWRDRAIAWLNGEGVNNQGRVRSDNIVLANAMGYYFVPNQKFIYTKPLKIQVSPLPHYPYLSVVAQNINGWNRTLLSFGAE